MHLIPGEYGCALSITEKLFIGKCITVGLEKKSVATLK
jgi:hypothetical protein